MATRNKLFHQDSVREKIQASQLVNRLQNHVFGKVNLSATQVQAATTLLKKVLPDKTDSTTTVFHDFTALHEAIANGTIGAKAGAVGDGVGSEQEQPSPVRH